MPCQGCSNPAPCEDTCQVFTSEQILRERVMHATKAMGRCQLTTTIPMRELERFAAVLLADGVDLPEGGA